jgi:hypothetical protein
MNPQPSSNHFGHSAPPASLQAPPNDAAANGDGNDDVQHELDSDYGGERSGGGQQHHPIAEFLYQLTKMLSDENTEVIEWSDSRIKVHDPQRLEMEVLHRYFRHSKFASFQRQLNYFGFRKIAGKGKMSPCSYVNDSATPDIRSLLLIKRKTNGSAARKAALHQQQRAMNPLLGLNLQSLAAAGHPGLTMDAQTLSSAMALLGQMPGQTANGLTSQQLSLLAFQQHQQQLQQQLQQQQVQTQQQPQQQQQQQQQAQPHQQQQAQQQQSQFQQQLQLQLQQQQQNQHGQLLQGMVAQAQAKGMLQSSSLEQLAQHQKGMLQSSSLEQLAAQHKGIFQSASLEQLYGQMAAQFQNAQQNNNNLSNNNNGVSGNLQNRIGAPNMSAQGNNSNTNNNIASNPASAALQAQQQQMAAASNNNPASAALQALDAASAPANSNLFESAINLKSLLQEHQESTAAMAAARNATTTNGNNRLNPRLSASMFPDSLNSTVSLGNLLGSSNRLNSLMSLNSFMGSREPSLADFAAVNNAVNNLHSPFPPNANHAAAAAAALSAADLAQRLRQSNYS